MPLRATWVLDLICRLSAFSNRSEESANWVNWINLSLLGMCLNRHKSAKPLYSLKGNEQLNIFWTKIGYGCSKLPVNFAPNYMVKPRKVWLSTKCVIVTVKLMPLMLSKRKESLLSFARAKQNFLLHYKSVFVQKIVIFQ